MRKKSILPLLCVGIVSSLPAQQPGKGKLLTVADGWAANSVNAVIFRKNSLTSFKDTQYVAFYNADKKVVLGKRCLHDTTWQLQTTAFSGNANDAHNTISIMVDGAGYLHLSWDHHNNPLHYSRSVSPGSLQMSAPMGMTGKKENKVSYPEFYRLPGGNLLFMYRDGGSGNGNLVLNRYDAATQQWKQIQENLIDGEGRRNAYCQTFVDSKGIIHISWVWRETPDVATNHDMCYARSEDGGVTWQKTTGEAYVLPVTAATAEYACRIPQRSELINQTSMYADDKGHPYIATYWKPAGTEVPQFQLVYHNGKQWLTSVVSSRTSPFSLSGTGTKKIPVSRPQIMVMRKGKRTAAYMVYRDEERGSKASVAYCSDIRKNKWSTVDVTDISLGQWEPSYDTDVWQSKKQLHLFVQKVAQGDGEKTENVPPQPVGVLEWKP
jgi:hypothetical protein